MRNIFRSVLKTKFTIPADTPPYLKKALERALKEYQQGIKKEKSALENFAEKYIIDGEAKVIPIDFFVSKSTQLKDFFINYRNIKIRLVLICLIEKQNIDKRKTIIIQDRAYFQSETHINLEATDVKELLSRIIYEILTKISIYQKNGSG